MRANHLKPADRPVQHHLVIAGTGRAGTSFLVKYLTAIGLDTGLSRKGEAAHWDEHANAGLEDLPLVGLDHDLPYVIKSPWIGEYIDQILDGNRFTIDALIIPVRDLVESATSRSVIEHRALHQNHPWMADRLDRTWELFGLTPGGTVFSLNPLDQARLLALSFHKLVQSAVEKDVPLLFVAFPRMVEDGDYLYRTLHPVLPAQVTADLARGAHERVASKASVRIRDELNEQQDAPAPAHATIRPAIHYPSHAEVDNMALRRELRRARATENLARNNEIVAGLNDEIEHLRQRVDDLRLRNRVRRFFKRS